MIHRYARPADLLRQFPQGTYGRITTGEEPASSSADVRWAYAVEVFLRRDLATGSRRVYKLTLDRVQRHLDGYDRLATITPDRLARTDGKASD